MLLEAWAVGFAVGGGPVALDKGVGGGLLVRAVRGSK